MWISCRFLLFIHILHTVNSHSINRNSTRNITNEQPNNGAALRQNSFWEWLQGVVNPTRPSTTTTTTTTTPVPASERECAPCECGLINSRRIIGGNETAVNAYPWMTIVLFRDEFNCGGSLINDRFILTAAHCFSTIRPRDYSVRLLEHDLQENSTDTIFRNISRIMIHEDYDEFTYDNDVALMRLSEPVEWSDLLRPICLPPNADNDYAGEIGLVTGWGQTSEDGPTSNVLLETEVPILSQESCRNMGYDAERITDNMLCAGYEEGGKDPCTSDSGGPLHVEDDSGTQENYLLAGVVSWGEGCGDPDKPGVYARVTRYLDWISERTGDACGCDMIADRIK